MKGMTTYDKAVYPTISCKVDNKGILRKIKRYRETGEITPPVENWPALTNEDQVELTKFIIAHGESKKNKPVLKSLTLLLAMARTGEEHQPK
jgi:hypothetical protein